MTFETFLPNALILLAAYLIGAMPTAYLTAKKLAGIDIREHGSKNAGATNVMRVVGKKAGFFVMGVDFCKGLLPVVVTRLLLPPEAPLHDWIPVLVALMAILGHSKSVFLQFTGGKSAITGLGAFIGLEPLGGLILAVLAFVIIKLTRMVSVGSMTCALLAGLTMYLLGDPMPYVWYGVVSGVVVIVLHRANIQRLLAGTENRI
jgi:glycerol-3-phosphate acyltransferase PlsY